VSILAFVLGVVFAVLPARAQQPGEDPLAQHVFPPELIMKHAPEIGIDDKQRAAIKEAVQRTQSRFLDAQWELQAETEKMLKLLQATPVDETAVLAQADRVMDLERQIKKTHLALLVRLKNLLSDAQKAKLQELRGRK
jgi:Spy/CpxP family protein refolding chaperone